MRDQDIRFAAPSVKLEPWSPPTPYNSLSGRFEMMQQLETYLLALEDERRKIEAFKRELPLCMQLLEHAIETSKEQLGDCHPYNKASAAPGTESWEEKESSLIQGCKGAFTDGSSLTTKWERLRTDSSEDRAREKSSVSEKPAWMSRAQLWDRPCSRRQEKESSVSEDIGFRSREAEAEQTISSSQKLVLSSKQRPAGAFLPFIREKQAAPPMTSGSDAAACNGTDLSLSSPGDCERTSVRSPNVAGLASGLEEVGSLDVSLSGDGGSQAQANELLSRVNGGMEGGSAVSTTTSTTGQPNRKARRCWSPELHRRFVNALQQLGGSQVATPKQIRELMKVDGLTNDEVKSHLQKYRLHTRRPSLVSQPSGGQPPQLVVLGGIWVPPEYAAAAAAAQQSSPGGLSGVSPFCQRTLATQDFYSLSPSPQLQLRQPPFYEQQQAASQTQSSQHAPKLTLSSGDHTHSDHSYREFGVGEEGKSDSTSWKGDDRSGKTDEEEGVVSLGKRCSKQRCLLLNEEDDGESRQMAKQAVAVAEKLPKTL